MGGSSLSLRAAEQLRRNSPIVQRPIVTMTKSSKRPTRKRKLFIENLSIDATDEEIFDFMSQLGGRIEKAQTAVRVNNKSKVRPHRHLSFLPGRMCQCNTFRVCVCDVWTCGRSEVRSVGKECVSTCSSVWWVYN